MKKNVSILFVGLCLTSAVNFAQTPTPQNPTTPPGTSMPVPSPTVPLPPATDSSQRPIDTAVVRPSPSPNQPQPAPISPPMNNSVGDKIITPPLPQHPDTVWTPRPR